MLQFFRQAGAGEGTG